MTFNGYIIFDHYNNRFLTNKETKESAKDFWKFSTNNEKANLENKWDYFKLQFDLGCYETDTCFTDYVDGLELIEMPSFVFGIPYCFGDEEKITNRLKELKGRVGK